MAAIVPGYESVSTIGMFAPARTPPEIIKRLNEEVARFINTPEAKQTFFERGADAVGSSPEELERKVKSEISRLGKVIRDAGIRGE